MVIWVLDTCVLAVLVGLLVNELVLFAQRRRWFQPPETVFEHKVRVLYPAEWDKRKAAIATSIKELEWPKH